MSSPRDADANRLSNIVVVWSTALSPHARQSKYDAFLCIIPHNLQKYWDHTFDGNGSIRSTFSTSVDDAYVEMMRIINTYSRKTTYAFSSCRADPSPSLKRSKSLAASTEPSVGKATNNKQQAVLTKARKRKPPLHLQEQWKREKEERARQRAMNNREYNNRLDNDVDFAKQEMERKARDREKIRARRQESKLKKERDAEVVNLFGLAFGRWGELQREYKAKVGCPYMPCGNYQFFSGSRILDHGDMFTDPIVGFPKKPLILGMPLKCNWHYRNWYHSLPIHPEFVDKEGLERVLEGGSYDEFAPFRYIDRHLEDSDSSSDSDTSDDYCDLDSNEDE
jgi:hypothetical protein